MGLCQTEKWSHEERNGWFTVSGTASSFKRNMHGVPQGLNYAFAGATIALSTPQKKTEKDTGNDYSGDQGYPYTSSEWDMWPY